MGFFGDIAGAAIGGAASFFGGESRNEAQLASAREVMEFNAREAELDREFQHYEAKLGRRFALNQQKRQFGWTRDMSNTRHQRETHDLKRAGLNRILAFAKGQGGATFGSGGTPTAGNAGGSRAASGVQASIEDSVGRAASTALDYYGKSAEVRNLREVENRTRAETGLRGAETERTKETTNNEKLIGKNLKRTGRLIEEQVREAEAKVADLHMSTAQRSANANREIAEGILLGEEAQNAAARRPHIELEAQAMKERLKGLVVEGEIDETTYGKIMRYIHRVFPANSAVGVMGLGAGFGAGKAASKRRRR